MIWKRVGLFWKLPVTSRADYTYWTVNFPTTNNHSWSTTGLHIRPCAVQSLYGWPALRNKGLWCGIVRRCHKIYLSFSPKNLAIGLSQGSADLTRVAEWCCAHSLLITLTRQSSSCMVYYRIFPNPQALPLTFLARRSAQLDHVKTEFFNNHVTNLTSSLLSSLCQINRVKHLFSKDVLMITENSLVFNKLFYCSTVWSGISKQNISKL